jgi:hypothetical protein
MPARRRIERDPRETLVRLVERLSQRHQFVTLADLERAAARSSRLPHERLAALVEDAVAESMLLMDRRTFFDRASGAFSDHWVYRVNPRHPLVAEILEGNSG